MKLYLYPESLKIGIEIFILDTIYFSSKTFPIKQDFVYISSIDIAFL